MIAKKRTNFLRISYFLIGGLIASIIIVLYSIFKLYEYNKKFSDKIYPNVFINEIDVSGYKKDQVINALNTKSKSFNDIFITVIYKDSPIATYSGELLKIRFDSETAAEQAYLIGRSKNLLSRYYQILTSLTKVSQYKIQRKINYDQEIINELINRSEESYNKPAKNALFKFENGRVVNFRKEESGIRLLTDEFNANFKNNIYSLEGDKYNKTVQLKDEIIKPEITLGQINSYGIEELIALGVSDFSHSIPERIHNVILAASKFNGILIPKDKILSFNETIGDISSLTGYKPAYIIKEGKTVLGDGGGVCQVSTTLFRAALNSGLPIIERHPHAYRVSYYENDSKPGFDATIFSPSVDLKVKNDTPAYILIQTEIDKEKNLLYFRFYGKKDNRRVEISDVSLWDVTSPPAPRFQEDPTLKKGVTRQVDFPAWGSKASFLYKVYKDNQLVIDEKYYSFYKPWQAVFLVGTAD